MEKFVDFAYIHTHSRRVYAAPDSPKPFYIAVRMTNGEYFESLEGLYDLFEQMLEAGWEIVNLPQPMIDWFIGKEYGKRIIN